MPFLKHSKLEVALFTSIITALVFIIIVFFFYVLQEEIWEPAEYCREFCSSSKASEVKNKVEKCRDATNDEKNRKTEWEFLENIKVGNPKFYLSRYFKLKCPLKAKQYNAVLLEKLYKDDDEYIFKCIVGILSRMALLGSTECGLNSKSNLDFWLVRTKSQFWSTGGFLHRMKEVKTYRENRSSIIIITLKDTLQHDCFTPLKLTNDQNLTSNFKVSGLNNYDVNLDLAKIEKYGKINEFSFGFLNKTNNSLKFLDCQVYKSNVSYLKIFGENLKCGYVPETLVNCKTNLISSVTALNFTLYGIVIGSYCDTTLSKNIYFVEKLEESHINWIKSIL